MSSVREFEREIWRALAEYARKADADALMFDETVSDSWTDQDWERFARACENVARRAGRYGGVEMTP
jgi:sugar phosphate isomerase/epimerase